MATGKRNKPKQKTLWILPSDPPPRSGHSFHSRINRLLDKDGFDAYREQKCTPFFATGGHPVIPPGVYFRMLFIGYLKGFQSERAIAWHCADRMSLWEFPGYQLHEPSPGHSSLTIRRQRLPLTKQEKRLVSILEIVQVKRHVPDIDTLTASLLTGGRCVAKTLHRHPATSTVCF